MTSIVFHLAYDDDIDRIKELCIDLKNKIQLKIEEAIAQLNEHKKQMITEVEEFERDCIKSYQANEKKITSSETLKKK